MIATSTQDLADSDAVPFAIDHHDILYYLSSTLHLLVYSLSPLTRPFQHKALGNALFGEQKYEQSIAEYTHAISYNPQSYVCYANRAFAYTKTEMHGAAISDADQAIKIEPAYLKSYYRRAVALVAIGRLKAVKDFKHVVTAAPRDTDARTRLVECEKELRRILFEEAIASDEVKVSALERLGDFNALVVDASYTGPHLLDTGITSEFVHAMLAYMRTQKIIHRKYALQIMFAAHAIFKEQPAIIDIKIPEGGLITVCGDVHGQYFDFLNIFETNGYPSDTHYYLFNGDFVDRGSLSIEIILALFALKVFNPKSIYLSRGNHETDSMNQVYGFEKECKATFKYFSEIFNALPLGNLINERIFVLHGGLFSRDGVTMDELKAIDRFRQPENEGLMCEMLWADPQPEQGRSPSKRGVGLQFGPDFCKTNNLQCIIRSHEVKQEGYSVDHNGQCITIFSAPNYCDSVGNKGAYINIRKDLELKFVQFNAIPPPIKSMQYAGYFGGQM